MIAHISREHKSFSFAHWTKHPLWSMVAAFGCYFCVYGFRKPFTAGQYVDQYWLGIHWKSILISSQIAGYMLSKWCGIFFVSSITWEKRARAILISILIAELALLGFGIIPKPWNLVFLVMNGLPLGMIFGYIQGFLEGKKNTELYIAALGSSFILADGVSKSVGINILIWGVSETWMPFFAGLLYALPLLFFVWMLTRIPKPSEQEVADRAERTPMNQADRIHLVKQLWPGILTISILYLFASLLRGMRSDFAPEIWKFLGFKSLPETYSHTEIWVTVGILAINGSLVLIRSNYKAFFTSILAIATGFLLLIIAGFWGIDSMGPFWLIVLTGFGIYLPYLTITTSVFERMIAITRHKANIGFLMYIVDSVGYLGYNVLLLSIGFIFPNLDIPELFFAWVKLLGIAGMALCLISSAYFIRKLKN
jgi:MFS family permease